MEIHKKRCKVKAEQALYKVAKLMLWCTRIKKYFLELDASLEKLSHKKEEFIPGLPSWALCHRKTFIGHITGTDYYAIKIIPDDNLNEDIISEIEIKTNDELNSFLPFKLIGNHEKAFNSGLSFSDIKLICEDSFGPTMNIFEGIIALTSYKNIGNMYSQDNAKKDAINIWNQAVTGVNSKNNFTDELRKIFTKFNSLINQRNFKERKIHRYINSYAIFLLPKFKKHYYECELFCENERRKADFILQREDGFPPMLIELENPKSKMITNDGEWTCAANHAKNQIAEWAKFIDKNPENSKEEMDFLSGPDKERLVIMGRGLKFMDKMNDSKYSDTIMWTYDLMIKEAKENWNQIIRNQCKLLKVDPPELF